MHLKTFFIIAFLSIVFFPSTAQIPESNNNNNFYLENKYHYGFIWAHSSVINYFAKGHVPCIEINIGRQTDGKQYWHQVLGNPSVGVGYYWANLGNPDILGNVNAVYYYINIPIIKKSNFTFNYNLAAGLSYLSKCFDIKDNYYNVAIGSHFNSYLNVSIDTKIRLFPRLLLINGIGITHFSNGSVMVPNLGLNVIAYNCGIKYLLSREKNKPVQTIPDHIATSKDKFKRVNEFSIIYAAGAKEIHPPGERKYFISLISANIDRIFSYKRKAGLGIDVFYDGSISKKFQNEGEFNIKTVDLIRPGIHISHDLVFNKLSFTTQLGVYIFTKWEGDGYFYHRFGLKYKFTEHFFANLTLKTHYANADFTEWGFGYCF